MASSISGNTGPGSWVVNGHRVPTAATIYQLVECDQWWWRNTDGGITHHPDHQVITGVLIGTGHGGQGEFLDHRTIMTRMARESGAAKSRFQSTLGYAKKTMMEKRAIGVVVHKSHPTLREHNIQFPGSEVYAILGGWWVMTDLWIDWQVYQGETTKVLMAKLELMDTATSWWLPLPRSGGGGDDDDDDNKNEDDDGCPACGLPTVARYFGAPPFCGRPECWSSDAAQNQNHTVLMAAGQQRVYQPDYVAARAPLDDCAGSFHTYLPSSPQPLTKTELASRVMHHRDSRDSMVTKPGWNAYLCDNCLVFNQRIHWDYLECRKCHRMQPFGMPALDCDDVKDGRFAVLGGGGQEQDDIAFDEHISPLIKAGRAVLGTTRIHTSRYIFVVFELADGNRVAVGFPKWDTIQYDMAPKFSLLQSYTHAGGGDANPAQHKTNSSGLERGVDVDDATTSAAADQCLEFLGAASPAVVRRRPALDLVRSPSTPHRRSVSQDPDQLPLTGWFGHNFGVPYKTRMQTPTVPMNEAPIPVTIILRGLIADLRDALSQMHRHLPPAPAAAAAAEEEALEFNEVLLVGNYPGQKMNWHSDGEDSVVGDVVASVSLGSLAYMSFGLRPQYYTGKMHQTRQAVRVDDLIVQGTAKEDEKRQLRAKYDDGTLTEDEYLKQMDLLVKSIRAVPIQSSHMLLKFPLPFGAIMIQDGKTLNQIYLHKVEMAAGGLMRFALTARKLSSGD